MHAFINKNYMRKLTIKCFLNVSAESITLPFRLYLKLIKLINFKVFDSSYK